MLLLIWHYFPSHLLYFNTCDRAYGSMGDSFCYLQTPPRTATKTNIVLRSFPVQRSNTPQNVPRVFQILQVEKGSARPANGHRLGPARHRRGSHHISHHTTAKHRPEIIPTPHRHRRPSSGACRSRRRNASAARPPLRLVAVPIAGPPPNGASTSCARSRACCSSATCSPVTGSATGWHAACVTIRERRTPRQISRLQASRPMRSTPMLLLRLLLPAGTGGIRCKACEAHAATMRRRFDCATPCAGRRSATSTTGTRNATRSADDSRFPAIWPRWPRTWCTPCWATQWATPPRRPLSTSIRWARRWRGTPITRSAIWRRRCCRSGSSDICMVFGVSGTGIRSVESVPMRSHTNVRPVVVVPASARRPSS